MMPPISQEKQTVEVRGAGGSRKIGGSARPPIALCGGDITSFFFLVISMDFTKNVPHAAVPRGTTSPGCRPQTTRVASPGFLEGSVHLFQVKSSILFPLSFSSGTSLPVVCFSSASQSRNKNCGPQEVMGMHDSKGLMVQQRGTLGKAAWGPGLLGRGKGLAGSGHSLPRLSQRSARSEEEKM